MTEFSEEINSKFPNERTDDLFNLGLFSNSFSKSHVYTRVGYKEIVNTVERF